MNALYHHIDVTEKNGKIFSPNDLKGTAILLITGITEATLADAANLALTARRMGTITAGVLFIAALILRSLGTLLTQ